MKPAIQYLENFTSEREAKDCFAFLKEQCDYIGGRILPPLGPGWWTMGKPLKTDWTVQTFHELMPNENVSSLPDGCRLVVILDSQKKSLGIA